MPPTLTSKLPCMLRTSSLNANNFDSVLIQLGFLDFEPTRYYNITNRTIFINNVISVMGYTTYLEIGCEYDTNFSAINVLEKVGVDPVCGGTVRMGSDDFFAHNTQTFDIIFIDGDHHAKQLSRDIENSLKVLNDGGLIVCHDCLPECEAEQITEYRPGAAWTGTCGNLWHTFVAERIWMLLWGISITGVE